MHTEPSLTDKRELLRCDELLVGYRSPLLPPISLTVRQGEFWAVVGRNGSGKSTWFKTVLGLLPSLGGSFTVSPSVAYVAQRRAFDPLYPVTVEQVVAMGTMRGPMGSLPFMGPGSDEVSQALDAVGAGPLRGRTFRSLSEGQKQRVLLARMVVSKATLAFLDEPTAAMDQVAEKASMALLVELRERYGMALMVVSHHLPVALSQADQVLFLDPDHGSVVQGPPELVCEHPDFLRRYGSISSDDEASP